MREDEKNENHDLGLQNTYSETLWMEFTSKKIQNQNIWLPNETRLSHFSSLTKPAYGGRQLNV